MWGPGGPHMFCRTKLISPVSQTEVKGLSACQNRLGGHVGRHLQWRLGKVHLAFGWHFVERFLTYSGQASLGSEMSPGSTATEDSCLLFTASSSSSSPIHGWLCKFSISIPRTPNHAGVSLFVSLVPSLLSDCLSQKQEFLPSLIERHEG